jgi:hypothetical protein
VKLAKNPQYYVHKFQRHSWLGRSWLGRILRGVIPGSVAPGLVAPGLVAPASVGVPKKVIQEKRISLLGSPLCTEENLYPEKSFFLGEFC